MAKKESPKKYSEYQDVSIKLGEKPFEIGEVLHDLYDGTPYIILLHYHPCRYQPTCFQEELELLKVRKGTGAYTCYPVDGSEIRSCTSLM